MDAKDTGTPVATPEPDLTKGTPVATTEPDDDKTVEGLVRKNQQLRRLLAEQTVKPSEEADAKVKAAEEKAAAAEAKAARLEVLTKYGDVAPTLKKLLDKPGFDVSLIDDDFVNDIREARGSKEETIVETGAHNPPRGQRPTQEQTDEANLRSIGSLWDLA